MALKFVNNIMNMTSELGRYVEFHSRWHWQPVVISYKIFVIHIRVLRRLEDIVIT